MERVTWRGHLKLGQLLNIYQDLFWLFGVVFQGDSLHLAVRADVPGFVAWGLAPGFPFYSVLASSWAAVKFFPHMVFLLTVPLFFLALSVLLLV